MRFSISTKLMKTRQSTPWNWPSFHHYHSYPNLIQSLDQHNCQNMTLNKLLQSHPSVCCQWLKWVKTARTAYLKDGQTQQSMNKYMMPIQQTTDKGCTHSARDLISANNHTQCTTQKHKHHTALDDSILPWLTPRHPNRNISKSIALSATKRCQGWVPSESLEKFLPEVNLCNKFQKQNSLSYT